MHDDVVHLHVVSEHISKELLVSKMIQITKLSVQYTKHLILIFFIQIMFYVNDDN